jgi:L-threonylcarbamoyladenylate synthase
MGRIALSDVVSSGHDGFAIAASALQAGALAVIPTDTVYGLAADAFTPGATQKVFDLKKRPRSMALPVLVSRPRQAWALCDSVPPAAAELAAAFWPGALTMILPQTPDLDWDLGDARGTIALRVPAHPGVLSMLELTGPLAVTSANVSGESTPRTIEEIRARFGDSIAVYVDDGPSREDVGSTIVDLARRKPAIVREGPILAEEIEGVIGARIARA